MTEFSKFNFIDQVMKSINDVAYTKPTSIQNQAIPYLLKGRDMLGIANTGTGKTAAFSLPIINRLGLSRKKPPGIAKVRVLVLTPTRELASQVHMSFKKYGKHLNLFTSVVFGGVKIYSQIKTLNRGVDVLVATPGRLLDLIAQGYINLSYLEVFVLDEADRLLDMGFAKDINKIISKIPSKRQTLLFSATMPKSIASLADKILVNPIKIEVVSEKLTANTIKQKVYFVDRLDKSNLLMNILRQKELKHVLVFTRTKYKADRLVKQLSKNNIEAIAIHGDKTQSARENALKKFKSGKISVLIATDIAARGLDIPKISHVVNFNVPAEPENYVHRIGRTGRAGQTGVAITLCDEFEQKLLKTIEKVITYKIPVETLNT